MHGFERTVDTDPLVEHPAVDQPVLERPPIDLIIPFYRTANLVSTLVESLQRVGAELERLRCSVVLINDSPDDLDLQACLPGAVRELSSLVPCELVTNPCNLGFIASANLALRRALEQRHDVILLNSDTIVSRGALAELQRVAYLDPMTGFVSPRSNNASLCSLPLQEELRKLGPAESHALFLEISRFLPDSHFVPTGVGFCMFIKREILEEFGVFDETFGQGYSEENDLVMRANRCGYRVALANHAWIYHVGGASFSQTPGAQIRQDENAAALNRRYPEFLANVQAYEAGPHYEAERLLAGLLPDRQGRRDLLFDFTSVGPYHNGTFTAAKEILARAVTLWPQFNLSVMSSEEAWRYHKLDQLKRVNRVSSDTSVKFAVGLRFGQPFHAGQMFRLSSVAAVNVYGMLDPIAFDCLYLNAPGLETLWRTVFEYADGVIYISEFVGEQFRRRFRLRPGLRELVSSLSLDCREYRNGPVPNAGPGSHILVIGNHFDHKRVPATVEALSQAFPNEKISVIGVGDFQIRNVTSYRSGKLAEIQMEELWSRARFVVFPSTYEGFGIPVVESMAYRKPILVRALPPVRSIREKMGADQNIILYSSTRDLVERLKQGFPTWQPSANAPLSDPPESWETTTERIGDFLSGAVQSFDFENVLVPRLTQMRLLRDVFNTSELAVHKSGRNRVDELQEHIDEIHRSWSWRLTSPLRQAAGALLRIKTDKGGAGKAES
jgi:GT2 family glycosyltransferase